jgi:hypothetical protein
LAKPISRHEFGVSPRLFDPGFRTENSMNFERRPNKV